MANKLNIICIVNNERLYLGSIKKTENKPIFAIQNKLKKFEILILVLKVKITPKKLNIEITNFGITCAGEQ